VSVRVPLDVLAESIPAMRDAGVTAIECGDVEIGEPHDTIPAPSAGPPTVRDFPAEEPKSDRVARELGWIRSPGEPEGIAGW
jgi:hypothetical protein